MLKTIIIGVAGFMLGAGTVEAIVWTQSEAAHRQPTTLAATAGMPSIAELHARARAQDLPDTTVREPF